MYSTSSSTSSSQGRGGAPRRPRSHLGGQTPKTVPHPKEWISILWFGSFPKKLFAPKIRFSWFMMVILWRWWCIWWWPCCKIRPNFLGWLIQWEVVMDLLSPQCSLGWLSTVMVTTTPEVEQFTQLFWKCPAQKLTPSPLKNPPQHQTQHSAIYT